MERIKKTTTAYVIDNEREIRTIQNCLIYVRHRITIHNKPNAHFVSLEVIEKLIEEFEGKQKSATASFKIKEQ